MRNYNKEVPGSNGARIRDRKSGMRNIKSAFLGIFVGIGIVSLASCGRDAEPYQENIDASALTYIESGMAESGAGKGSPEGGTEQGGAAENGISESSMTEDGTADEGRSSAAGSGTADAPSSEGLSGGADERSGQKEAGTNGGEESVSTEESALREEPILRETPQLPVKASGLAAFVPEGWEILDSVELDFNEDGIPDYVGVLEAAMIDGEEDWTYQDDPRILFAVTGDGAGGYCLDFQDINLIRTRGEGGVFGDPYEPLTAEGTSFTTHAYGGSAWRWSEDFTYTYRGGAWYLTASETTYGYGSYITSYSRNDWEGGIGIRKERSSEFSDMEENWDSEEDWDSIKYDFEYELSLDEPMTLEQAGKNWWLAKDRVANWEVASVTCAEGVELSEEKVKRPEEAYVEYCDEDCALYSFSDEGSGFHYLAMYRWEDRMLSVLAQEEAAIESPEVYKGKIYYAADIVENVKYKTWQDGKEQTTEEEDTVGVRLNRISLDGTGKETVFEYRYPEEEQEIRENQIPYLSLICEISGGEIIAEVYIGGKPHPFYRMKTDGSGAKKIGQVPMEEGYLD